ncbi:MAG: chemotaxis protein MotA [Myxococcota bacterium]|jgi:chemotaxis protein MotA
MDLVTVIGLVVAFGLILAAILTGGPLAAFIDIASLLIVAFGSFAALMIAFPGSRLKTLGGVLKQAFFANPPAPEKVLQLMQDMSNRVRKEGGLLALEDMTGSMDDAFLKRGVQMIVDGYDPQAIQEVLYLEIEKISERHGEGAEMFDALGAYAPAFGMIGTLVGLVQMLQALDDPSAIGPAMAVALLTTFYGSIIANVFAIPIAKKLNVRSDEEVAEKMLMAHGLLSILAGENPRFMAERLNVQLPPQRRVQEAS